MDSCVGREVSGRRWYPTRGDEAITDGAPENLGLVEGGVEGFGGVGLVAARAFRGGLVGREGLAGEGLVVAFGGGEWGVRCAHGW
jgi:hypothetical protein